MRVGILILSFKVLVIPRISLSQILSAYHASAYSNNCLKEWKRRIEKEWCDTSTQAFLHVDTNLLSTSYEVCLIKHELIIKQFVLSLLVDIHSCILILWFFIQKMSLKNCKLNHILNINRIQYCKDFCNEKKTYPWYK